MIMRQWRGRVPREKAEEYLSYLQATGLADYRNTPGNLGVFVTTRPVGKATEFLLVTFWESLDAVRRFAGDDHERAVYYPEDDRFLLAKEPKVDHHQVKYAAHDFNRDREQAWTAATFTASRATTPGRIAGFMTPARS